MTRKSRTILFVILAVLFLIIGPSAVLYSQGYRFDFRTKKIVQIGGLYFKVSPNNAQIYLNGYLKKKTDFFFGSAFIENLLPEKYNVEIKKDGFYTWKKSLEIKERQVTEAKNIVLIPQSIIFNIFSEKTEDFYFSPDGKKIILKEKGTTITVGSSWALKLYDIEKNIKSPIIESGNISREKTGVKFSDLNWSPDFKKIILETYIANQLKYFIIEIDKTPSVLYPLDFLNKNAENISFDPSNTEKILFTDSLKKEGPPYGLFGANYKTKNITDPILTGLITYKISEGNIFWFSDKGILFKSDLSGNSQDQINPEPLSLKKDVEYQIYTRQPVEIFLKEGTILYFFNNNSKSFEKLFESTENLEFSPDTRKIVYSNHYEIWVLFIEPQQEQPRKEKMEKLFLTRFSEKIGEVSWLTSHYLIFKVGNIVKVAEIDDRDQINIVDLVDISRGFDNGGGKKIFFNNYDKKLYILGGNNLFSSETLIK